MLVGVSPGVREEHGYKQDITEYPRITDLYETTVKIAGSFIGQYINIIAKVPNVAVVLIEK